MKGHASDQGEEVMADPRAFISFDFDNNLTDKHLFVGQIKNSRTPFSAPDRHGRISHAGDPAITLCLCRKTAAPGRFANTLC